MTRASHTFAPWPLPLFLLLGGLVCIFIILSATDPFSAKSVFDYFGREYSYFINELQGTGERTSWITFFGPCVLFLIIVSIFVVWTVFTSYRNRVESLAMIILLVASAVVFIVANDIVLGAFVASNGLVGAIGAALNLIIRRRAKG